MKKALLFLLFILFSAKAVAQYMPGIQADRLPSEARLRAVKTGAYAPADGSQGLMIFISIGVLAVSCLVMLMATSVLWRIQAAPQLLKISGAIAVVGISAAAAHGVL